MVTAMKARLPLIVQDKLVAQAKGIESVELIEVRDEEYFLDGPIIKSIAVVDFDPATSTVLPGVPFDPPTTEDGWGEYRAASTNALDSPSFINVNAFATVLLTKRMFEEPDVLGREVKWAFDGPQLFVVPRAGAWANAYYERDSRSLQLFYFPSVRRSDRLIFTALSRDIVAHETAHAVLDGIAPDLYDAITPQSLALHEAVADLSAFMMATRSEVLCEAILNAVQGDLTKYTALSSIAEEYASEQGEDRPLRNLFNDATLDPSKGGSPVDRSNPHELGTVLSGAMYSVFLRMYKAATTEVGVSSYSGSPARYEKALFLASQRLKRVMFRALDYLPPGDVSFADYGRAMIASDQKFYPNHEETREWIRDEFLERAIVSDRSSLRVAVNPGGEDLETMARSDWTAYRFANERRDWLGLPSGPFEVKPRLIVKKKYYHKDENKTVRELIFKIGWDVCEDNDIGAEFPKSRRLTVGMTMVFGFDDNRLHTILRTDHKDLQDEQVEQKKDRDSTLRWMAAKGLLLPFRVYQEYSPLFNTRAYADSTIEMMHIKGTGRMLHMSGGFR